MKKKYLALLFLIILLTASCAPKALQWSAARPLKWDDFLASYSNGFDAHTYWSVKYTYHKQPIADKYLIDFKVQNLFIPDQSWIRQGAETNHLLMHEQLHFDICELYTRKLYIAFTKKTYTANYRHEIKEIFANTFKELKQSQVNYDTESNHSLNKEKQTAWEALIKEQLAQTPPYPYYENIKNNYRVKYVLPVR